jgi:PST family polysaccharide transporter
MSTYRQIFKSTALLGGTEVVGLVVGMARTKVLALLLGRVGQGLAGNLLAASGLVGTISGLGIGSSGVRQIAEATASGDGRKLARTVAALRLVALVSSLAGMLVTIAFSCH